MSASVSAIRDGQPSTTQPIAAPWLSPKVVTRKRWPKVLNDMAFYRLPCRSPRTGRGQMDGISAWRSPVTRDPTAGKHVDHALVDGVVRGVVPRRDPKVGDERPRGAAVGGDHRVPDDGGVPRAHPDGDLFVVLAAGRQEAPFVGFAPGDDILVPRQHVVIGEAFPLAEGDLGQPLVG